MTATLDGVTARKKKPEPTAEEVAAREMVAGPGSRACRHPRFPQEALRAYHAEHGMLTESWSPIGRGQGLLEDQTIIRLAAQKQKSPAQVVLHLQRRF